MTADELVDDAVRDQLSTQPGALLGRGHLVGHQFPGAEALYHSRHCAHCLTFGESE